MIQDGNNYHLCRYLTTHAAGSARTKMEDQSELGLIKDTHYSPKILPLHINRSVLERRNASALAMELWLSCTTVYPKKYAHGFCFAVLCCGYTLTDFPISIRLTSLALWQSNDCPSASKATLMNMDKYFMWIHYERLHNHNKAKHNKTVCIFLGIYCKSSMWSMGQLLWVFWRKWLCNNGTQQ